MTSDLPLPRVHQSVVHMLAASAEAAPDAIAVLYKGTATSYGQLWGRVLGTAHALGDRRGERVAVAMGNSLETLVVYFAVLKSGAQLVMLNPAYTATELRAIIDDAAPSRVIYDATARLAVSEAVGHAAAPVTASVADVFVEHPDDVGDDSRVDISSDALALLQYTGGTSGLPKGVNLTHGSLAVNVAQREALLPTDVGSERVLCVMPVFHSYALCMGIFLAFNARGTLVLHERYRPTEVFAAVRDERITIFPGSPTLFVGLLGHAEFEPADWETVHTCYSGSAPLPAEILTRWEKAVGAPIYEGYGQTEAGSILTFNPRGGDRKLGSVGVPVAATEVQIVDLDTGTASVPALELGEVRARGPQVMQGYRERPDETAIALRDGWLYTGDIGFLDDDGYLFIRDRKKEMSIVSGYNVYPREVEEVLFKHEAVLDAAVVGVPDPYRGEVLHAFVVSGGPDPGLSEELLAHCSRQLARYKVPTEFHVVAALPKTSVNKTDRLALKSSLADAPEKAFGHV